MNTVSSSEKTSKVFMSQMKDLQNVDSKFSKTYSPINNATSYEPSPIYSICINHMNIKMGRNLMGDIVEWVAIG
jgi:hypothetical protein